MDGKPVHLVPAGVHRPLRMPTEQARLPLSEMRESVRRRVRRERRLQPTQHHPRLQLPETHDRQSLRQLQAIRTTRSLRAEPLRLERDLHAGPRQCREGEAGVHVPHRLHRQRLDELPARGVLHRQ